MNVRFCNNTLKKNFSSKAAMVKAYGKERANNIEKRYIELTTQPNLELISHQKPSRRHQLAGSRKKEFGVDVSRNYRIVFTPTFYESCVDSNNAIVLSMVTDIIILGVEDYH